MQESSPGDEMRAGRSIRRPCFPLVVQEGGSVGIFPDFTVQPAQGLSDRFWLGKQQQHAVLHVHQQVLPGPDAQGFAGDAGQGNLVVAADFNSDGGGFIGLSLAKMGVC